MSLRVDIQATLYVATKKFPVKQEYEESKKVLMLLDEKELAGKIKVLEVSQLKEFERIVEEEGLDYYVNSSKVRLPYLACIISSGVPGLYGFAGLEDITNKLYSLGVLQDK